MSAEGVFLNNSAHPRAYGNVPRLLNKYVYTEKIISLEEAVYKLSHLPCSNLKIRDRGMLKKGFFADINVFDLKNIKDLATFKEPHQLSVGMDYVLVNGELVIEKGLHTGKFPGKFVKGPGYKYD